MVKILTYCFSFLFMSDSDWKTLDIQIFTDCASQMQFDEIIANNEFDSEKAMRSNTVGSPRADSHTIAKGIHSIDDYISEGNYLPDENITNDEIRQIQGKLIDIMISRFNGHNLFQTVLTCVYVHKKYSIQNGLLRTVIFSFVNLIYTIESFVDKYRIAPSSMWAYDNGIGVSYLHEKSSFEPVSLRRDLEDFLKKDESISDIVDLSVFMLDLSEYFLDFQHKEIPKIPEKIPKESAAFGFSDVLHNRQLSTSIPPTLVQIKSHEKSLQQFAEMLDIINEFKNIPKPSSVLDLISFVYDWNVKNCKAIIIARILLGAILFPDPNEESFSIYGWPSFNELLISDFNRYHVTDSIYKADKIITVKATVYEFVTFTIRSFLMPFCHVQSSMEKRIIKYWNMVSLFLINSLIKTAKFMSFPKTDSESMNRIVENPMIDYSLRISLEILNIYLKMGFKCDIYNVLDYEQIFLFFSVIHKSLKDYYYDIRVVSKVYEAFNFQNKSPNNRKKVISNANVIKRMGDESNEEIAELILCEYFEYCVYYMQFILKTNSIKIYSNEFYNPKQVFENRRFPLTGIDSLKFIEFDNYQFLYDPKNYNINQIQTQIKRKANDAKELIKKLNSRQNPPEWIKDILKRIVTSSLMLMQWKEGDTFSISLDNDCIPSFQLVKAK